MGSYPPFNPGLSTNPHLWISIVHTPVDCGYLIPTPLSLLGSFDIILMFSTVDNSCSRSFYPQVVDNSVGVYPQVWKKLSTGCGYCG
jgi:hypothetical protein